MTPVLPFAPRTAPPKLALAVPAGPPPPAGWPVVVFVRGGAPAHAAMGRYLAERLPAEGFAVAEVHFGPAGLPDVTAAVQWLRAHRTTPALDPDRFAAWGHAEGGHLAVLLAVSGGVQAVVAWSAPSDFSRLPPNTPFDTAATSPLTRVTADAAPLLAVHGTADDVVPIAQSETLVSTYWQMGADAEFRWLDDVGHAYGLRTREAMTTTGLDFLRRQLGAPGANTRGTGNPRGEEN
ncbi:dienelactone hydrolase family protein [Amycolatopsis rhabdoformis]|uniref:Dienelactone hydrolase family protein n=1 Tax=Amycolatopsis rhabdoformis TaxID=1448059 RepID=A0ABZ1IH71_9PSEU|nr:dienelactone hydrolase family protein [Amycolatopsis rhabdoformis]WSE33770.1 dienelactone hydrolase family protein [Amycolatopsis rhabdoformis]